MQVSRIGLALVLIAVVFLLYKSASFFQQGNTVPGTFFAIWAGSAVLGAAIGIYIRRTR
jgi:hypothetical protein